MKTFDIDNILSKLEEAASKILLKGQKEFKNGKPGAWTAAAFARNDIMQAVANLQFYKKEIDQILND